MDKTYQSQITFFYKVSYDKQDYPVTRFRLHHHIPLFHVASKISAVVKSRVVISAIWLYRNTAAVQRHHQSFWRFG
jgi:hypothetical protein